MTKAMLGSVLEIFYYEKHSAVAAVFSFLAIVCIIVQL